MILLIAEETQFGAVVQLTHDEWATIRRTLGTLRGGADVVRIVDQTRDAAPAWGPFRVKLTRKQLDLMEAAAARIG